MQHHASHVLTGVLPHGAPGLRKVSSDLWCQIRQFCKAKAVSQMVSEKDASGRANVALRLALRDDGIWLDPGK